MLNIIMGWLVGLFLKILLKVFYKKYICALCYIIIKFTHNHIQIKKKKKKKEKIDNNLNYISMLY